MNSSARNEVTSTNIATLLRQGNLSQANQFCRQLIQNNACDPQPYYYLSLMAESLGLTELANHHYQHAQTLKPEWSPLQKLGQRLGRAKNDHAQISQPKSDNQIPRYVLIKPWGYGFWADVDHVLGQLLVAELSGRVPVTYWGSDSLFNSENTDGWLQFFQPLSDVTIERLTNSQFDYYPHQWNAGNLHQPQQKFQQSPGKMESALLSLNRPERVIVSDYFTGIKDLIPWIPPSSNYFGLSLDEIYRALINKYLKPSKTLKQRVEQFQHQHLFDLRYLAVHIRGSDKTLEVDGLDHTNTTYDEKIKRMMAEHQLETIFLMTDDENLLKTFQQRYGKQLITTDCRRTSDHTGIHTQQLPDPHQLGLEVATDVYLAAGATAFIGNGSSNPSQMVSYLKNWSADHIQLLGPSLSDNINFHLYRLSSASVKSQLHGDIKQYQIGLSYFQKNQLKESKQCFQSLCDRPVFASVAHQILGLIASRCGDLSESVQHLEHAILLEPENGEFHLQIAEILRRNKQPDRALKYAEQAVRLSPNQPAAYNNLGIILKGLSRLDAAEVNFREAISRNNQYYRALYNLGNLLEQKGQFKKAENCYQQALSIKPDYEYAQKALANLL